MAGLAYGSALLLKTARQSFWNAVVEYSNPYEGVSSYEESTQLIETRARLGAPPMPSVFKGDRNQKDVNEYSYTAENGAFDSTIRIDKKLVKFDQIGEVSRVIAQQGQKAAAHPAKLLSTATSVAHSTVGEDGQFFYDTDHADSGAVYTTSQDNDLTGAAATGVTPTDLEALIAIRAMVGSLMTRLDDQGDPFEQFSQNPADYVLMVPASMYPMHRRILVADQLTGGVGNDMKGQFTLRINPFLTTDGIMFMFYMGGAHRAMIMQQAGGIEYDVWIDKDSNDMISSATYWGVAAYGNYRTSVRYEYT